MYGSTMTPVSPSSGTAYRTKLIEVALPLEAINTASSREKSIRHGHPSTLHLWWARRPLAACRAVLLASLVDDPSAWPDLFPTAEAQEAERKRLFAIIEDLVVWENSTNEGVLLRAHTEIARSLARSRGEAIPEGAEAIRAYLAAHAPPVYDPFCGGGSIPLEALRLGLEAHGSDLNPVAVLITKALIEIPPKFAGKPPVNPEARKRKTLTGSWPGATGLAEDVRYYGQWMRDEAEKRIGHLYPKVKVTEEMTKDRPDLVPYVGQELTVIAWLWARTVKCPNPGCGARTPLVRSFYLSKKKGKEFYANPILDRMSGKIARFEIKNEGVPLQHTTDAKGATCLFCGQFIKKPQLRDISIEYHIDEIPLAIVLEGDRGRIYVSSDTTPILTVKKPSVPFLDQPMTNDRRWFSPPLYGMPNFSDIFTPRQLVALTTFSDLVEEARDRVLADAAAAKTLPDDPLRLDAGGLGAEAYADAVATYLAFGVDKASDKWSSLASWDVTRDNVRNTFGRQALPMVWDFAETCPFSDSGGSWSNCIEWVWKTIEKSPVTSKGFVKQVNVTESLESKKSEKKSVLSTDPPYYDNIGYSDLSDFFYVWLRRSLQPVYPTLFSTLLTPKSSELIASQYRHDGSKAKAMEFFESGLGTAFSKMNETQDPSYPMTVYYAFKQAESGGKGENSPDTSIASTGWETMLAGLILAGFMIEGTWPMRTELGNRMVGMGTNALASSILLVCRPRPAAAPLATRREFMAALKQDLPRAMRHLQQGNIAPVDLAQASIGPGMAVFTRYEKVLESDGTAMTVRTALGIINQVLDEVLAEQEGEFDGDTRWAVAWFDQFGMNEGPFGEAETLSKAKNVSVNGLVEAGVLAAKAGKVKLLGRDDLPEDWDPATDTRLTVWETTQHLIRRLDKNGETGAAELLGRLGGDLGSKARDLAYRLYAVCERKKWATEALAYNSLIISWPEIERLARAGWTGMDEKGQRKLL